MEISLLKALLRNISCFFHLLSHDNINCEPVHRYYQKIEEILKLIKPVLDAITDAEIASEEQLHNKFAGLSQYVDELRELFENWHPLMSKVYFVLQVESLISKVQTSILEIFELLKSSDQYLPVELNAASLELCAQKIKQMGYEHTSVVITKAIKDQVEGSEPSSESQAKFIDSLSLRSNQELLIEAVALEKLKENAEQAEKNEEAEYIDQMIALITHMHERLVMMKQSESCNPVLIPADFCCPLSLELMTDPVIVASGQTYERAFIHKWIDLGLTVCPKTRQTLAHTNLIPNYTVKALIANWCETNNVKLPETNNAKLPDPLKSMSLNQPSSLSHPESGAPRDLHILPHSRANQPISPRSPRSMGSPGKNLISSSGIHREGTSPSHPRSSSEDSLPGVAGNGHGLDIGRTSVTNSEDRLVNSEERSLDSCSQPPISPSRKELSSASGPDEQSSQGHNRTVSASSTLSNANFSQGTPGDGNEVPSQVTAYSSDTSGEVTSEPLATTTSTTPQREHEFPLRLEARSRSQIWRRPSERFVPRIVSSPAMDTRADLSEVETQVRRLVDDLKSTSSDAQRNATAELRLLAKHNMDNRIVIASCGAINLLVELLSSPDTRIQENAVTALLNLSINDNNKTAIANAGAIEPLIHVLETGSPEAKENSAATLFSLSVIEDNKVKIGRSGAIKPLVDLLGNGTPRGKKDAATALFNLSIFHENKARIVQAGAVKYLVELMDPAAGMVDKAVAVLANLATIHEGRAAIGQEGGIPVLVEVVELGSARGKENAAAALLQLCTNSGRFCNTVLQEGAVPPLVALSQSGTPRAKEKAQALLNYFRSQRHGNAGRG
ncbi:U-box domain-containing protein 4 isoform X2 [Cornus florida]|nr:U-box domain-containing protein 4 isoform X2 [Cornus florida]XP_059644697.1 U-box domain-containing protein 4 isoform X2 [Cornus florida]XP_059644698.1 U-box domain-containing protein 4 isoform X2 [Cornus florida]